MNQEDAYHVNLSAITEAITHQVERLQELTDLDDEEERDRRELLDSLEGIGAILKLLCRKYGGRNFIFDIQ